MRTYIYGFTRASHPLPLEGAAGVGAHAPELRAVREGDLAAVVSDAPADLRAKRRDLMRHESVLERLCANGAVLPMRFGTVAADERALRAELRSRAEHFIRLLSRLEDHIEINIKGTHREDVVLQDLLLRNPALAGRSQALQAAGGGSHHDKVEFGRQIAGELQHRRSRDAGDVVARLQPYSTDCRMGPPVDGCFVNASFLVHAAALARFDGELKQLALALNGHVDLRWYGPLPPYSFVEDLATRR